VPGLTRRHVDLVDNIEVYPLLCRLLQIQPDRNDASDTLAELLSSVTAIAVSSPTITAA